MTTAPSSHAMHLDPSHQTLQPFNYPNQLHREVESGGRDGGPTHARLQVRSHGVCIHDVGHVTAPPMYWASSGYLKQAVRA